jgi:hypothetical protein
VHPADIAMLFAPVIALYLVGSWIGAAYFASPRRKTSHYDRQYAAFTYAQAALFSALPAIDGQWGYSIFAAPFALYIATRIIDRRQRAISERERAARHHRGDSSPN